MPDDNSFVFGTATGPPADGLSMSAWIATEGGRKCPMCNRYALASELGWVGLSGHGIVVDAYGHLPGYGCNKVEVQPPAAGLDPTCFTDEGRMKDHE